MNLTANPTVDLVPVPTDAVKQRIATSIEKLKNYAGHQNSIVTRYISSIAHHEDWEIQSQEPKLLPYAFAELISLKLRDEGNLLIEETRQLNNRYVGWSYRSLEAALKTDLEVIYLCDHAALWAQRVANEALFKLRNKIKAAPIFAYSKAYDALIRALESITCDQDHMYPLVWNAASDVIACTLLEEIFIKTRLISTVDYSDTNRIENIRTSIESDDEKRYLRNHLALYNLPFRDWLVSHLLTPLLTALKNDPSMPPMEVQQECRNRYFSDMLEAFSYLVGLEEDDRYFFTLPESPYVGAFTFNSVHGIGRFFFNDSRENLVKGLEGAYCMGTFEVLWNGEFSFETHPLDTISGRFGKEDGLLIAYWMLRQVHDRIVADYLAVEDYYLHHKEIDKNAQVPDESSTHDITAFYTPWIREAQDEHLASTVAATSDCEHFPLQHGLPQVRRNVFFKILQQCGVSVEQGKGSELKLLRDGKHPFRLGNHYGPNPTVPSFLAASILKRMGISRSEWLSALAAVR